MERDDPVLKVIDALNKLAVRYLLVGSYTSNIYGIPRSTQDADFLIDTQTDFIAPLASLLREDYTLDPQQAFENVTGKRFHLFRSRHDEFKVEVFIATDDPFDRIRFDRAIHEKVCGRDIWLPTPEDVLVGKLRWRRGKDMEDAKNVIAVQHGKLDWPYVHHWCDQHGTRDLLDTIVDELRPLGFL